MKKNPKYNFVKIKNKLILLYKFLLDPPDSPVKVGVCSQLCFTGKKDRTEVKYLARDTQVFNVER